MRPTEKYVLLWMLFILAGSARAEYCLNWSAFVSKHSGSSGHCWATERECESYRMSRPAGDYVGGCYFRPGQYPRTGEQKGGGAAASPYDAAAAAQKKKLDAMKRQQQEQERQTFEKERQQLLGTLKGAAPAEPANTIVLKPIPPAGGAARSQLDCVAGDKSGNSWDKGAKDCTPIVPGVPEPPKPSPAPSR